MILWVGWVGINNMKVHIREEKKTAPLKFGKGTLFQNKDGEIYKLCDMEECDETYTEDEVIKVALSEENMIRLLKVLLTRFRKF